VYKRKIDKSDECLNCEEPLSGENFCPNCGQFNNERKPNVSELFFEMLSNVFAFDSKFYRSIGPLLFSPGKLSVTFVEGKRQYYMLPIRMFIVITILFLTINSLSKGFSFNYSKNPKNTATLSDGVSNGMISDSTSIGLGVESFDKIFKLLTTNDALSVEDGLKEIEVEPTFFNRLFYHQVQKFMHSEFEDIGNYLLSKFLIYALLFIPFIALLLNLFYLNLPKYFYIDHFIFAVHQQTVLITLLLINIIFGLFFDDTFLILILLFIVLPIHLLKALKTFYKEAWWLTILKFILVNIGFFFISGIFVVLAGIVTFLLY
jgi:hypothetical protein